MAKAIDFAEADELSWSESGRPGVYPLRTKSFGSRSASCWALDAADIAEIQRTGVIWVVTDMPLRNEGEPQGRRWQPAIRVTTDKANALLG